MKKIFLLLIAVLTVSSCQEKPSPTTKEKNTSVQEITLPDTIPAPQNYKQLATAEGDLNKDSIPEKVIIYNTPRETDFGTEREIHIFQKKEETWQLWHKSVGAVLPSQHGGMLGDPFQSAYIENGCLVFDHFGGSRDKWKYTHRFRYQNERWELIGTTVLVFTLCEIFKEFDYNLSTGKIIVKKTIEDCENEDAEDQETIESYTVKMKKLPVMDGFYPGSNEVKLKEGEGFYY